MPMEEVNFDDLFWQPNWGDDNIEKIVAELHRSGGNVPFERWNEFASAFEYLMPSGFEYFVDGICEMLISQNKHALNSYYAVLLQILYEPSRVEQQEAFVSSISAEARGKIYDTLKVQLPEIAKEEPWVYVDETLKLWNPGRK